MTLPSFRSMYLVKGTLTALAVWFVIGLWLNSHGPVASRFDALFYVIGLFFVVNAGMTYALAKEADVRQRSLITDDQLKDYERETLRLIRAANPWCERMPTNVLYDAWYDWSTEVCHSAWLKPTPDRIRSFLSWAFTRPIDRF